MIYKSYAMHDRCTGFLAPTLELNDDAAVRHFQHAIVTPVSDLYGTHPDDFSLYFIGTYNSDTGVFLPQSPVECVITGSQALQSYHARVRKEDAV